MDSLTGGNTVSNNPRMNLLQGGSGVNGQQTQEAAPVAPMASDTQPMGAAPAPAPTAPPAPEPTPQPTQPSLQQAVETPEPRPVTPDIQAVAPKKGKGALIGVVVGLLLLAGAGIGAWWFLTQRNAAPEAPAPIALEPIKPTELAQEGANGTQIEGGGATNQSIVKFKFKLATNANTGSVVPEIELRPAGTAFTGEPTITGQSVNANGSDIEASVDSDTLTQGAYHWQARVSKDGDSSEWAVFGDDPVATAFTVDTAAPAAPTVSTIGGKAVANPTIVTSNQPEFSGTAEANSKVKITISPEGIELTATADANGKWAVTSSGQVANGQHDLTIVATDPAGNASTSAKVALSINPATVADTAPKPTPTGDAATPPATTSSTPTTLAATGDDTKVISIISLLTLIVAAVGLGVIRRRYAN